MRSPLLVLLSGVLALGCDRAPTSEATPPTGGSATAAGAPGAPGAPSTPSVAEPPPPPPADLDVAELQAALKCGPGSKSKPCAVLAKVASCAAWTPSVPSGDGRWLGRAWSVEGAKTTEVFVAMRVRNVPLTEIGPGQLNLKIALIEIPKSEESAFDNAERALRSYERGDVPPRASPTLEYLKQRKEWPDAPAVRTRGGQVFAVAQGGTYFCEGPRRTVLAVQLPETGRGSGNGLYAELWATTW
ncbi:hypothetical protein [Chondromyces apiculatus]|uniref:Lipoprotein n=1 Tax=Chondromyces apiculatus DSM 436 TaxID=1192034 RepID=A0A017TDJ7_9BACT|nr:hypothetical protein [Chondromyces apiculatus]EYF06666.1 Hypothetical protein CAP_1796 [Chondromyces apiculatus DSM 436]